jgi:pyruvate formate lyase activating enzyme
VERAHELGIHVELTYLIIPTLNDSDEEIRDFVRWVCDISPEIPVHLSRFHPDYKLTDIPPTPTKRMLRAYEIAKEEGLKYVYLGNFWDPKYESTYCPSCGAMVIERHGYIVRIKGLRGDRCAKCGARLHFVL